jgi:uncharacterized protein (DUF302 family)
MNFKHGITSKSFIMLFTMMLSFLPSLLLAETTKNLAVFYTLDGNAEAKYNKIVAEELPKIGFNSADPHHRVNDQYKSKYGSTTLDVLSFLPVVNDNNVMPLFTIDPRLAGFAPFNMLIHKKLDEKVTHVGHLTPEAMLDILGISDKEVREKFIASFKPLDALLDKEFGADKKSYKTYTTLSKDNMLNFEYTFERPEDMDDFIDEFQNKFEMSFINKEYLIAGFHDFKSTDEGEEALEEVFDIFWAYSLCHLEYSYNMFDNKGARPDAGLFAPCTMYMYVKKESNKLVIGMPKLVNIMDTLGVKEPSRVALVKKLDREIPEILTAFGMKAVTNVNPLKEQPQAKFNPSAIALALAKTTETILEPKKEAVQDIKPVVVAKKIEKKEEATVKEEAKSTVRSIQIVLPKVPTVAEVKIPKPINVEVNGQFVDNNRIDRSIKFSKRVPPNYLTSAERYGKDGKGASLSKATAKVGDVDKGRISAYLRADLIDVPTAIEKLKKAGFEVLASVPLDKKKKLISIVFTNAQLQKMASKTNRGFIGTLRLLIDPKNKQISITNPVYLGKAMLQNDFDEATAKEILATLVKAFPKARNSMDKLKYSLLPNYQFMDGMPFYKDMEVVARGDNLLEKLKKKKNKKKVVFQLKLANGSTLIGVKLAKRTSKFPKRIGTNNAGMLPYPILIENGEAKIMEPKYYLALMYPQLTMEEFMTIATIPGAIIKDCTKVFR